MINVSQYDFSYFIVRFCTPVALMSDSTWDMSLSVLWLH